MAEPKASNLLETYLALPAIISLLAAGAIGVWTCATTLSEIKHDAQDTRKDLTSQVSLVNSKLDAHSSDISDIKKQVQDVSAQEASTKWTLAAIQKQIDAK